jgi:hypothetical protein
MKKFQTFASVYFNFLSAIVINNHFVLSGYDIMTIVLTFQEGLSLTLPIWLSLGF